MNAFLFLLSYVLGLVLPMVFGAWMVDAAATLARGKRGVGLVAFTGVPVLVFVLLSFTIYNTLWGNIGPGAATILSCIVTGPTSFFLAFRKRRIVSPANNGIYLLVGCLLIPASLIAAPFASTVPTGFCDKLDRDAADEIITALDAYQSDHGSLPDDLNSLVPQYLPRIPNGPCHPPTALLDSILSPKFAKESDYQLCEFPRGMKDGRRVFSTTLNIMTAAHMFYQAFDLEKREWLRYDGWDNSCYPIRSDSKQMSK